MNTIPDVERQVGPPISDIDGVELVWGTDHGAVTLGPAHPASHRIARWDTGQQEQFVRGFVEASHRAWAWREENQPETICRATLGPGTAQYACTLTVGPDGTHEGDHEAHASPRADRIVATWPQSEAEARTL